MTPTPPGDVRVVLVDGTEIPVRSSSLVPPGRVLVVGPGHPVIGELDAAADDLPRCDRE